MQDGGRAQTSKVADVSITVAAIRRYPVKSMGGESLEHVELDARGLVGDRRYAVVDGDGKLSSGKDSRRFRRRDQVFSYAAGTSADGRVEVRRNGSTWVVGDDDLDAELSRAFGDPVRVLAEADVPYFDDGPVSLVGTASLEWCRRELGVDADPRRTRTNLVLETTQPFEEETWAGRSLRIGSVELVGRPAARTLPHGRPRPGRRGHDDSHAQGARRLPRRLSGHAHRRGRARGT